MPKESLQPKENLAESGYKEALRRLLTLPTGEHKELRYELDYYEKQLNKEVIQRIM